MAATTEQGPFEGTVFLDRDGTINRKAPDDDYVKSVEEFAFLPTAVEAVRALNEARYRVIVVTNQRGIALGRMTESDLGAIHEHMVEQLAREGATIDAIYYCPHERNACDCRKPRVGMFLRAAADHPGLRLNESAIFGDSQCDMAAGMTLDIVRVLVARKSDGIHSALDSAGASAFHHQAGTLLDGVRWFLAQGSGSSRPVDRLVRGLG